MKNYIIAMILASVMVSPMATAESGYGGASFSVVNIDTEDFETDSGNIGLVLGAFNEHGWGYEFMYTLTLIDDSESLGGGVDLETEVDTVGLFAVYKTKGQVYVKAKAGYGYVSRGTDVNLDDDEVGSTTDSADGIAYGLAIGTMIGEGMLELSYYRFPDIEEFSLFEEALEGTEFEGADFESDVQMLGVTYSFSF